jgi:hypothetical protein
MDPQLRVILSVDARLGVYLSMRIRQGLGVTYALTGWEAASLLLLRTLFLLALAALIDVALLTSCYARRALVVVAPTAAAARRRGESFF